MTADLDRLIERFAATTDTREREQLALVEIPDEMFLGLGLREHVTASGIRVVIEESVRITVKAERRAELHRWLEQNGYHEELSALRAATQNKQARAKVETTVLGPLAVRILEGGPWIDLDLLGVSRLVKARIPGDSAALASENVLSLKRSPE